MGCHPEQVKRTLAKNKKEVLARWGFTQAITEANMSIIEKGKEIILEWIQSWRIPIKSYADLKALHWILDEAFRQNQLMTGWATENRAIEIVIHKPE